MISAREAACQALIRYDRKGTFPSVTLEELYRTHEMERRERALSAELCLGTLERLLPLDYHLERLTGRPMKKLDPPVRAILRISAYQLLCLTKIPEHAAVNEGVLLAGRMCARAKGFVNGVLRSLVREKSRLTLPEGDDETALSLRHSIGLPLVRLLMEQYPKEHRRLLQGLDSGAPLTLFVNHAVSDPEEVARLTGAAPTATPGCLLLPGGEVTALPGFSEGDFFIVGRSSAFAVQAAAPKEGETVIDLCAAPGGKSFLAASL
ncbi:MAG: hypothetical protein IJF59_00170, partial [Clostridia bacterium]|nr:hypothetical protein [Clostridia bacterium]